MSDESALEKLRDLFSDYEDLEHELYINYESSLSSYGLKFGFYFSPNIAIDYVDFFQKNNLWSMIQGSFNLPDIFFSDLRTQMRRPWILAKDYFDIEIQIGTEKLFFPCFNGTNILDLQQLSSQITLFHSYPHHFAKDNYDVKKLALEFKQNKSFIVKLVRKQKETGNFREYLEKQNYLKTPESYKTFLEQYFQSSVKNILNQDSFESEMVRMDLQARLSLWGFRYSKILSLEELLEQFNIVKVSNLFPSVLDIRYFIEHLSFGENKALMENINKNDYKKHTIKFLSKIENKKILLMKYNGINLENRPEFVLNLI